MRRYVVTGDWHLPWIDKRAFRLFTQICDKIYKYDMLAEIILNGDISDFHFCSQHVKDPSLGIYLRDERISIHGHLKSVSERYPSAKKVYIVGNHEHRLTRFFQSKAPELYGIMDLKEFLGLDLFGFRMVPYGPGQAYRIDGTDIAVRHEGISNGANATLLSIQKASSSIIFNHTHKLAVSNTNTIGGKSLTGINSGCMCDFKNVEAPFQFVKNNHQWQLGFTVITVRDDRTWYYQLVHIRDHGTKVSCMFDGHIWEQE